MGCGASSAQQFNEASLMEKPVCGVPTSEVAKGSPVGGDPANCAAFVELFGEQMLTKQGLRPTQDVLSGKSAVGIYFSAHWCPPCRNFTPQLAGMYSNAFKDKGMEIVFVSGDRDSASFNNYYAEMPWVALPYEKRDLQDKLSNKYQVRGIPSLVVLGPAGNVITTEGRQAVTKDPTGKHYPWKPPTEEEKAKIVIDTLGREVMTKLKGKPFCLYFSAHWCPPCRGFTPKLAEFYKDGLNEKMEIVFVSSDRDEASFSEYFKEMPWHALPFAKREEKAALSELFGVNGIPSLVVLNADGTTITTEGRRHVMLDPKGNSFPASWH